MMEEAAGIQRKICCFLAPESANARHCLTWVARVVGEGEGYYIFYRLFLVSVGLGLQVLGNEFLSVREDG